MDSQDQFRNGFYLRTKSWAYLSDAQCQVLSDLALAQANHESGGFLSNLVVTNNNAVGYKVYPGSIWQKGFGIMSPEGDNYAAYNQISDCAGELADWIHRRKAVFSTVTDCESYAVAMKNEGWYGDTVDNYIAGMERWYNDSGLENSASNTPPDSVAQAIGYVTTSPDILYAAVAIGLIVILRILKVGKKLRI